MTRERVGVVGLGAMGGAMARNLVDSGFAVCGYDLEPERVRDLTDAGGQAAGSAGEVAQRSDVVILSLPSEAAFEAVAIDPGGLAAGAHGDLVAVEMSTLPVALKVRGRDALAGHGITLLDCPLSGTGDQAVNRDLVVLASGDPQAVERCGPVFDGLARSRFDLGEFGAGSRLKFVANLLVGIHNVAAAEGLALADAAGLDGHQALEVLLEGAGASRMLAVRGPKMLAGDYGSGVRLDVFRKDLRLIADFAAGHGAQTPLLDVCAALYEEASAAGRGEQDTASVYELLRRGR